MSYPNLLLGDVKVGDKLPGLSIEVTPSTVVLGALGSRDWRPMHHDYDFAVNRQGTENIFVNTPHNAAYFERYITDWTGPKGRLGHIVFKMRSSVFPGHTMVFDGTVEDVRTDELGCGWAKLSIELSAGGTIATTCTASVALPTTDDDNPWKRRGDHWKP